MSHAPECGAEGVGLGPGGGEEHSDVPAARGHADGPEAERQGHVADSRAEARFGVCRAEACGGRGRCAVGRHMGKPATNTFCVAVRWQRTAALEAEQEILHFLSVEERYMGLRRACGEPGGECQRQSRRGTAQRRAKKERAREQQSARRRTVPGLLGPDPLRGNRRRLRRHGQAQALVALAPAEAGQGGAVAGPRVQADDALVAGRA